MDDPYQSRLVEAFAELLVSEGRTDLDYAELHRRFQELLGRKKTYTTVSRWLREFVRPTPDDERTALAAVLGVERDWLFSGTGPKHRSPLPLSPPMQGKTVAQRIAERDAANNKAAPGAGGSKKQA